MMSLVTVGIFVVGCFVLDLANAAQPFLWPLPEQYTVSATPTLSISASFKINPTDTTKPIVTNAIARYMGIIFPHSIEGNVPSNAIVSLDISVQDDSGTVPSFGMDESYSLDISSSSTRATLKANQVWGVLRGLETFSQLIIYDFNKRYYTGFVAQITDKPRFSHRGILMDTSRHFQTVNSLLMLLDSLSYNKFNVLHWHITDSQSFPLESTTEPKLWTGSYTMYERYTKDDVKTVINYANSLGIRVIPEFDMPGHAQSWCKGYPDICPSPSCNTPLNPATNATWDLLNSFIGEVSALFNDNYIHLGGDEVNTNCWTKTPSIEQWMKDNNYTPTQALQYFNGRAMNIAHANPNNKQVINWDEVFTLFVNGTGLDKNVEIVQVWHSGPSLMQKVVGNGFRGIMSPDPTWYLDSLGTSWQTRYALEPYTGIPDPTQQKLVIGGEACMWGETVDVSDVEQTIWPNAAAVGERLWSPASVKDPSLAAPRYSYWRCLLNERGIAAAPSKNKQARSAPPGPGSCYSQRRRLL